MSAMRRAFFQRFVDAVAERLDQGERTYNGSALTRPLAELGRELEEEAEDLAGWAFWIWMRAARLRRGLELAECGLLRVVEQGENDHHALAGVEQRPDDETLGLIGRELRDIAQESNEPPCAADDALATRNEKA